MRLTTRAPGVLSHISYDMPTPGATGGLSTGARAHGRGYCSQRGVLPSMSVNGNVTVPLGSPARRQPSNGGASAHPPTVNTQAVVLGERHTVARDMPAYTALADSQQKATEPAQDIRG